MENKNLLDQLNNKYDHHESHHIMIKAPITHIKNAILQQDLSEDYIISSLMKLRLFFARKNNKSGKDINFNIDSFSLLYQSENTIYYGLAGRFWESNFGLQPKMLLNDFCQYNQDSRLLLTYFISEINNQENMVTTETKVLSFNTTARIKMNIYWKSIRLFSGLIRKRMLNNIKMKCEKTKKG